MPLDAKCTSPDVCLPVAKDRVCTVEKLRATLRAQGVSGVYRMRKAELCQLLAAQTHRHKIKSSSNDVPSSQSKSPRTQAPNAKATTNRKGKPSDPPVKATAKPRDTTAKGSVSSNDVLLWDVLGVKAISGPVSVTVFGYKNRQIYLFGDWHGSTENMCNLKKHRTKPQLHAFTRRIAEYNNERGASTLIISEISYGGKKMIPDKNSLTPLTAFYANLHGNLPPNTTYHHDDDVRHLIIPEDDCFSEYVENVWNHSNLQYVAGESEKIRNMFVKLHDAANARRTAFRFIMDYSFKDDSNLHEVLGATDPEKTAKRFEKLIPKEFPLLESHEKRAINFIKYLLKCNITDEVFERIMDVACSPLKTKKAQRFILASMLYIYDHVKPLYMDIRVLRKITSFLYERPTERDSTLIIYAGDNHIVHYSEYIQQLGAKLLYSQPCARSKKTQPTRCIDITKKSESSFLSVSQMLEEDWNDSMRMVK